MARRWILLLVPVALLLVLLASTDVFRAERGARSEAVRPDTGTSRPDEDPRPESPEDSNEPLPAPVDLEAVDRDRDLHGIVQDEEETRVAGARLAVVRYPWRRATMLNVADYDDPEHGPKTRSAKDGTFALRLRRGDLVHLRVEAEGFAPQEIPMLTAGERVVVTLTPGAGLRVTVRSESGDALAGVMVRVERTSRYGDQAFRYKDVTGTDGTAAFEDLPPGVRAGIGAFLEGHCLPTTVYVDLPESGVAEKEIVLPRGRALHGVVTDAATGAPIAGARVGRNWVLRQPVTTDAAGRYVLHHASPPNYVWEIHCDAPGYGRGSRRITAEDEYDFALEKGDSLEGRLVDENGKPVAGARLNAVFSGRSDGGDDRFSSRHAVSESDGRFGMAGLGRGGPHVLIIVARGYGRTLVDFDPHPERAGTIEMGDVVLPPGRAIEGRVLEVNGDPIARTQVALRGANADRGRFRGHPIRPEPYHGTAEGRLTDDLGRFRFPDLSPGTYGLTVRRAGHAELRAQMEIEDRDVLDVVLRYAEGRELVVTVVNEEGNPVPRATVWVQHEGGRGRQATDDEGRATFTVSGKVREVRAPWIFQRGEPKVAWLQPEDVTDLPENATEVRFVMRRGAFITGRIVDGEGKPVGRVMLEARVAGDSVASTTANAEGTFRVTVPATGVFDLVVTGILKEFRGSFVTEDTIEGEARGIAPGAKGVVVRARAITADRRLVVRLLSPDGEPVEGAFVRCDGMPKGSRMPKTGEDGRVALEDLLARAVTISVVMIPPRYESLPPGPLTVVPEGQEITFRCVKGVRLEGLVSDENGSPVPRAVVSASAGGRRIGTVSTDELGRFSVVVPPETDIELRALWREGDTTLRAEGTGRAGEPVELRLR